MGGHSEALLERFPNIRLVGLDRDTDALRIAGERLAPSVIASALVHTVYDEIGLHAQELRGSCSISASRPCSSTRPSAGSRIRRTPRSTCGWIRRRASPPPTWSPPTARATSAASSNATARRSLPAVTPASSSTRVRSSRSRAPASFVEILIAATPAAAQRAGHPAKRVFQALRIEVNAELNVLADAIPSAMDALGVGGRIVVMSYQSLEDRLVKQAFAAASSSTAPAGLPVELPEHAPRFRILTKGAELADDDERARNPRAIPVRLPRRREAAGERMSLNAVVRKPVQPVAPERTPQRKLQPVTQPASVASRSSPTPSSHRWSARDRCRADRTVARHHPGLVHPCQPLVAAARIEPQDPGAPGGAHRRQFAAGPGGQCRRTRHGRGGLAVLPALSDGAVFGTGVGADWTSTVNPAGVGAVSNSLIVEPPPPPAEAEDGTATTEQPAQELPPSITDGLPSPTTH